MTRRIAWRSLVSLVCMFLLSCLFVAHRLSDDAGLALASSDKAFDSGDLKGAVLEARFASMASLSNSHSRRGSMERLEAIALGSESANRPKTALLGWMSLLSLLRSQPTLLDAPLARHSEQQVTYLIDKVSAQVSVGTARAGVSRLVLSLSSFTGSFARLLMLPALILVLLGHNALPGRSRAASSKTRARKLGALLATLVAATCWCVGWLIV